MNEMVKKSKLVERMINLYTEVYGWSPGVFGLMTYSIDLLEKEIVKLEIEKNNKTNP
jgi:hypothetical protein